ncbi:hypothetical protein EIN_094200 [Entamoeba invadens IP1]|uniref:Uncharacterized protein n=1 Tax=Entamoeba invadens IP1 TaxID=370355 RepID=A0A0A1U3A3_ENTIV|nr:hypothetical protein EIN_094200 [Entamoeba invadens IP1]ELP87233.1 hypothetical protein EIN_094200 [Entamoeba invadens IP1]|eukprot:XP_004254004.1 hypothetical protein EIN_094200 [Entamoeba invadens IP1]
MLTFILLFAYALSQTGICNTYVTIDSSTTIDQTLFKGTQKNCYIIINKGGSITIDEFSGLGKLIILNSNTVTLKKFTSGFIENTGTLTIQGATVESKLQNLGTTTVDFAVSTLTFGYLSNSGTLKFSEPTSSNEEEVVLTFNQFYTSSAVVVSSKYKLNIDLLGTLDASMGSTESIAITSQKFKIKVAQVDSTYFFSQYYNVITFYKTTNPQQPYVKCTATSGLPLSNLPNSQVEDIMCPCHLLAADCRLDYGNIPTTVTVGVDTKLNEVTGSDVTIKGSSDAIKIFITTLSATKSHLQRATFTVTTASNPVDTNGGSVSFSSFTGTSLVGKNTKLVVSSTTTPTYTIEGGSLMLLASSGKPTIITNGTTVKSTVTFGAISFSATVNLGQNGELDLTRITGVSTGNGAPSIIGVSGAVVYPPYYQDPLQTLGLLNNEWKSSCDKMKLTFDTSPTPPTCSLCEVEDPFNIDHFGCTAYKTSGLNTLTVTGEVVTTIGSKSLTVYRDGLTIATLATFSLLDLSNRQNIVITSSSTSTTQTVKIVQLINYKSLTLNGITLDLTGVTANIALASLTLVNSVVKYPALVSSTNKTVNIGTLSMDSKSKVEVPTGYKLVVEAANFDMSTLEGDNNGPLINTDSFASFVVNGIVSVRDPPTASGYVIIAQNPKHQVFQGSLPTQIQNKCFQRALVYVGGSDSFSCSHFTDLATKTCVVDSKAIKDTVNLDLFENYVDNYDNACPCYHDITGKGGNCSVQLAVPTGVTKTLAFSTKNEQRFTNLELTGNVETNISTFVIYDQLTLNKGEIVLGSVGTLKVSNIVVNDDAQLILNTQITIGSITVLDGKKFIMTCSEDTFIEGTNTGEPISLVVKKTLTVRGTSTVLTVSSLDVKLTTDVTSKVSLLGNSKLTFKDATLLFERTALSHATIIDAESTSSIDFITKESADPAITIEMTGKSGAAECSALATFATPSPYDHRFSANTSQSDIGCAGTKWVVCPATNLIKKYVCFGSTECYFVDPTADTPTTVLASIGSLYQNTKDCPCSNKEAGGIYSSDCNTRIPGTYSGRTIANITGNFNKLKVESSLKLMFKGDVSVVEFSLRGKIEMAAETNEKASLTMNTMNVYTKQPTKLTFELPTKIGATKSGETSSLLLLFKNTSIIGLGNVAKTAEGGKIISYLGNSTSVTITAEQSSEDKEAKFTLLLGPEVANSDISLSGNMPFHVQGDFLARSVVVSRGGHGDEVDKMPFIVLEENRYFSVESLSVIPLELTSYVVTYASDIYHVSIANEDKMSQSLKTDIDHSMLLYKTSADDETRPPILCELTVPVPEEPDTPDVTPTAFVKMEGEDNTTTIVCVVQYNETVADNAKIYNRSGCPCNGRYCVTTITAEYTALINATSIGSSGQINQFIVQNTKAVEVASDILNTKVMTVNGDAPVVFSIDTLTVGKTFEFNADTVNMTFNNTKKMSIAPFTINQPQDSNKSIHVALYSRSSSLSNNFEFSKVDVFDDLVVEDAADNERMALFVTSSASTNITNLEVSNARLYLQQGKFNILDNEVVLLIKKPEAFPLMFSTGASVSWPEGTIKIVVDPSLPKDVPIFIMRVGLGKNFTAENGVKFSVVEGTKATHLKSASFSSYTVKQICSIYVALVPSDFVEAGYECPTDPTDASEQNNLEPIVKKDVPTWVIVILIIIGVFIVIILILFVVFIVVARKILLRRRNLKVFNDEDNLFFQTAESSEETKETTKEETKDDSQKSDESSSSSLSSSSKSDSKSGSGSKSASESKSKSDNKDNKDNKSESTNDGSSD